VKSQVNLSDDCKIHREKGSLQRGGVQKKEIATRVKTTTRNESRRIPLEYSSPDTYYMLEENYEGEPMREGEPTGDHGKEGD